MDLIETDQGAIQEMNVKNIPFRSLSEQQKKQVSQIQKLLPISTTKNPTTFILPKDIKQEHYETGFEFIGYDNNRQIFRFQAQQNKEIDSNLGQLWIILKTVLPTIQTIGINTD